jgi:D-glycero-alpha-D-manno-heptose-7-phosphate kinase
LRISFAGGGSDIPAYYHKYGGAVLSASIDKYVNVILQPRYDDRIRIGYSTTELRDRLDDVQHDLVRESMRVTGVERGIEIATMADIPSSGSGLGSSSTVTVGLLQALYTFRDMPQTKEVLARKAVEIEVGTLGKPIGKQDQYIAAYGGLRKIVFAADESVRVETLDVEPAVTHELFANLMLFHTGMSRDAAVVLEDQRASDEQNATVLHRMVEMVDEAESLLVRGELDEVGGLLHHGWELKKSLATGISNPTIDGMYERARAAGALGGKITGAGAGGYLLLYCERSRQSAVRAALSDFDELSFGFDPTGARVLFSA